MTDPSSNHHQRFVCFVVLAFLGGCNTGHEVQEQHEVQAPDEVQEPDEDLSAYYSLDADTLEHLRRMYRSSSTREKTIQNLGDSISFSDCFVWHERTRLNRPGMLSVEGYIYIPKEWGCEGGVTSDWGRDRTAEAIQKAHPEVATILFGTNDLNYGRDDSQSYAQNLTTIIDACIANKTIPVVFAIPPAQTIDPGRLQKFNEALIRLARLKKVPIIYTDRLFRDRGGWSELCFDGVHPNSKPDGGGGYDLINRVFREVYERIEREVIRRDKPHFQRVRLSSGKDEAGNLKETYDRNGDQKADLWVSHLQDETRLEEYDSDFDQQIDIRWSFDRGRLTSGEEDMGRDGSDWIPFKMVDGWKNETP